MILIYLILITLIILLFILYIPKLFGYVDHFFAPGNNAYYQNYKEYPRHHRADLPDWYYTNTHTNFPFWNTQLGNKGNMSYDLRGDIPSPYFMRTPFNMATTVPIRNKPLYMVS